jgi:mono/diheme cytochrome c family protein
MRTFIACSLAFSVIAVGALVAQNTTTIKTVPLSQTSPVSGSEMYSQYCAVCHGTDGKGGGPAAAALKKPPTDLTRIAARNGGEYPDRKVISTLSAEFVPAHGSEEMPMWGDLFKSLNTDRNIARLRLVNLTNYVKSIQTK